MSIHLTEEDFKRSLPKELVGRVNPTLMVQINQMLDDPDTAEAIRDNIIGYVDILKDGKFKMTDYLNAVKYVSYKLMDKTNIASYVATFPQKYNDMKRRGVTDKDISSYVAAYNKSKLVQLIYGQTLTPTYILNADIYQKAINVQAKLMLDESISPKVRTDAANSILNHLKRPEPAKTEVSVSINDSSELSELKELTMKLASQQAKLINEGHASAKEVAELKIIQGEYTEVANG